MNASYQGMSALELYAAGVRRYIRMQIGSYFPNECKGKSIVVLREFLNAAQSEAKFFCGSFNPEIYGSLKQEFLDALYRGVKIQIITENEVQDEAKQLIEELKKNESCCEQVEHRQLNGDAAIGHFAIFDGLMFRQELNEESKEALVSAHAADGDPKNRAELMLEVFSQFWEQSKPEDK